MCEVEMNKRNYFVMQLHVTGRCNQKCKHCYHEDYENEILSFDNIVEIIRQYRELVDTYNERYSVNGKAHINITGGEPFIRTDIMRILELMNKNSDKFSYGILTNGSLITNQIARKIKELNVSYVQLSIDGDIEKHDSIRGEGNLYQTLDAIDILRKNNLHVMVSFTANVNNYMDFPKVAEHCRKHGVEVLWSDRVVPIGNANVELCLSVPQCMEYFRIMKEESENKKNRNLKILMNRSLQFIVDKKQVYKCAAGVSQIVVDEKGDILPCRRMPLVCGNVLENELKDVFFNSEIMQKLRNKEFPSQCNKCRFKFSCSGGARCISLALTSSYENADPFCPLIYYERSNNEREICLE